MRQMNIIALLVIWTMVFWTPAHGNCGGSFPKTADKGFFTSPNHPSNYDSRLSCTWTIEVDEGHVIKLRFNDFELEKTDKCKSDSVKIFSISSSDTMVGSWCGTERPGDYMSTTHKIEVVFTSDGVNNNFGGFSASWEKAVMRCDEKFNSPTGHIFNPNYPGPYPLNTICHWEITAPSRKSITFSFDDKFDVELSNKCAWDYIEMRLANKQLGKFCGKTKPDKVVVPSGQTLYVTFNSDKTNIAKGFYATWH